MAYNTHCILLFIVIYGLLASIAASPADKQYSQETSDQNTSNSNLGILSVVSIATTFCIVLAVLGCGCCFKRGFAKFEETTTTDTVIGQSYTNFNDFSPPTESTPSYPPGLEPDTVTIEPLPDLSARALVSPVGSLGQSSWLKAGVTDQGTEQGELKHINNPRFQFPRSQLSYVDEMGSGWFGKVLQGEAHRLHTGLRKTRVVIKQLRDTATSEEQVLFLQEVQPYREVNHPNVLLLLGQCIESMPFLLILEYAPFGDLKGYLQKHRANIQDMAHRDVQLRMACDMVSGLMWLHQADFIHIDLAARNCLVCADTSVKIGDYGISLDKYPDDYYITKDNRHAVPIRWLGPEVINITDNDMEPRKVTKESNVWSFGVIMLELCTGGQKPYDKMTNEEVLKQVVMEQDIRLDKPNLDVIYASRWFEIMMFCWLEADMRPTMKEIHELLMHLRSNRDRVEMDEFQNRWDALKPAAMQDSSESSREESQFLGTREDTHETIPTGGAITSGIANGFVAPPQGFEADISPNMNMNANVDVVPRVDAGGDFQTTPLGDILTLDSKPSMDSKEPIVNDAIDFVIQPTVAQDTETAPPAVAQDTKTAPSIANEVDDLDFEPFVSPPDPAARNISAPVSVPTSAPVPVPTSADIPEVLVSSPTSPHATSEENLVFVEDITPVISDEVQAAAPSARDLTGEMEDQDLMGTRDLLTGEEEDRNTTQPPKDMDVIDNEDEIIMPSSNDDDGMKQISNPLFQMDAEPVTPVNSTSDPSMTTPDAFMASPGESTTTPSPSTDSSGLPDDLFASTPTSKTADYQSDNSLIDASMNSPAVSKTSPDTSMTTPSQAVDSSGLPDDLFTSTPTSRAADQQSDNLVLDASRTIPSADSSGLPDDIFRSTPMSRTTDQQYDNPVLDSSMTNPNVLMSTPDASMTASATADSSALLDDLFASTPTSKTTDQQSDVPGSDASLSNLDLLLATTDASLTTPSADSSALPDDLFTSTPTSRTADQQSDNPISDTSMSNLDLLLNTLDATMATSSASADSSALPDDLFTSTPTTKTSDQGSDNPVSDDDSSLSFTSATSAQLRQEEDDGDDSSSYHTVMTRQSDDPSFYSFSSSSPNSSRANSIQTSTDGSFKTLTDGESYESDDVDEETYVDRTPESSGLDDSISDLDGGRTTPKPGYISHSGDVILHHEFPTGTSPNITSLHNTALDSSIFSQIQAATPAPPQQPTLSINQPSKKKGGLSISVASKKITQTQVKHTHHVQHTGDADLFQLYKKGDDYAVVQEVKSSGEVSSDLPKMLSSQSSGTTRQGSSSTTITTGSSEKSATETLHAIQLLETQRTVTVVRNVTTTSEQQRIIDLMSGPSEDFKPSDDPQTYGGQQEPLLDLMSSPPADAFDSRTILQASPMVSVPMASGDTPLIPDLLGDSTPVNMQHTMTVSTDGDGLTWKQEMDMQGGGQFTSEGKDGQSTEIQWSTSANLQKEQSITSSTGFGLPEFNLTVNNPESQQPELIDSETPGLIEFEVDPTTVSSMDHSGEETP